MRRRFLTCLAGCGLLLAISSASAQASVCTEDLNGSKAFGAADTRATTTMSPLAIRHGIFSGVTPLAIVTELAKGVLGAIGAQGYGWVLEQVGAGAPDYQAQLERMEQELRAVNTKLDELRNSVSELQGVTSQAAFSNLAGQAITIISKIKFVHDELGKLRLESKTRQKRGARTILVYICEHLLDKQTELNDRLVGTAPNADNLITSSSKAARDSVRYWTEAQSRQVRRVFEYYADYEALLLQLRVEWWHAIGSSKEYVGAQINDVKRQIETQQGLLKPDIALPNAPWNRGQHYFVDVRHPGLVWWPVRVNDVLPAYSAANTSMLEQWVKRDFGGSWDKLGLQPFHIRDFGYFGRQGGSIFRMFIGPRNVREEDGIYGVGRGNFDSLVRSQLDKNDGFEWKLATFDELQALISSWQGSPLEYLRAGAKPRFEFNFNWYDWGKVAPQSGGVIWTLAAGHCCNYRLINLGTGETTGVVNPQGSFGEKALAGAFAVRPADPKGYWY